MFAWQGRYWQLSKEYEHLPEQCEALTDADMRWLMVRRSVNIVRLIAFQTPSSTRFR